jgi:hypothetical protein
VRFEFDPRPPTKTDADRWPRIISVIPITSYDVSVGLECRSDFAELSF